NLVDTKACNTEIKETFVQLKYALERIQANVIQGGEVVRGLLKYSRPGDSGLEPLDLNIILDRTLEMVQFKVKLSEIDIVRDYPDGLPKIKGNLTQLEEVFFNFIDNAYDSIVERREFLGEGGYRGKITISAKPNRSYELVITLEDNGMGIKTENNDKLFTPFFTTKASTRSGTGLGLYVIKKIITENHKGKISVESEHKVGTRFIIMLPLAKSIH
ncbi:MAG: ATP-binding protein, partial [Candidatus Omnitrophica bacterium]|nr:ATP-binding protein [Candidatus Omnitrophota bacterium]